LAEEVNPTMLQLKLAMFLSAEPSKAAWSQLGNRETSNPSTQRMDETSNLGEVFHKPEIIQRDLSGL
jgi:hypothetical protein